ncbi:MAG: Mur ligase family protein [Kofleriaceae bacterium]|nr:Mur ligase family protein [Kofleriaceae bacterium]
MLTYPELLARLLPARRFGVVFGLERMRQVLDRLGAPDRRLGTVVHVAGTNGKGSTVAMIAALARAGGARVATYTSPHLSTLRERIAFDGVPIAEEALLSAAEAVYAVGGDELTFFEQITAIGMVAIANARVDVTVLEVGLGGRLDATNVVDAPVGVITGVAMDHEAVLGNTLEAIAWEKAGISKPGMRLVVGASGEPAAVPAIIAAVRGIAAQVVVVDDAAIAQVPPVALPGAHQRRNAAAALAAIDQLKALGVLRVTSAARVDALATVVHPGRFEVVGDVILDGAHNPHGARALAAALAERGVRPTLIVAVSADKDVRAIAEALAPAVGDVLATRYQQERALAPDALADLFSSVAEHRRVETAPDLDAALARAHGFGVPILVAGSLFLVGEARVLLLGAAADPIVVSDPTPRARIGP